MPGFKALKDRTTVLLGCSVAGCKLKTFVICHSESPRVFRHINKHTLSNKKLLLQDALLNCFASEMEKNCLENDIPFKILLIVGSSPGQAPFIGDLHRNIEVVFLSQTPLWSNQWIKKLQQPLKEDLC